MTLKTTTTTNNNNNNSDNNDNHISMTNTVRDCSTVPHTNDNWHSSKCKPIEALFEKDEFFLAMMCKNNNISR